MAKKRKSAASEKVQPTIPQMIKEARRWAASFRRALIRKQREFDRETQKQLRLADLVECAAASGDVAQIARTSRSINEAVSDEVEKKIRKAKVAEAVRKVPKSKKTRKAKADEIEVEE